MGKSNKEPGDRNCSEPEGERELEAVAAESQNGRADQEGACCSKTRKRVHTAEEGKGNSKREGPGYGYERPAGLPVCG